MNLMSLRSKTSHDTPYLHQVRDTLVNIGESEPWTVREIFAKGAQSKRFWNRVKLTEFPEPSTAAPSAPVASPLVVGGESKTVKALLETLRARRDETAAAIALIEKNLA